MTTIGDETMQSTRRTEHDSMNIGRAVAVIERADEAIWDALNTVTSYLDADDKDVAEITAELFTLTNRLHRLVGSNQIAEIGTGSVTFVDGDPQSFPAFDRLKRRGYGFSE